MVLIDTSVRKNQDIGTVPVCSVCLYEKMLDCLFKRRILVICDRYCLYLESRSVHIPDTKKVCIRKDRMIYSKKITVLCTLLQDITCSSEEDRCRGDNFFSYRINRRVRNLSEKLLEIVKQRPVLI